MYQTILFKAPGKPNNKPVVILSGLAYGRSSTKSLRSAKNCSTHIAMRLSRALSSVWKWTRCNCTPCNIFRVLFCEKVSMAVAVVVVAAMWWHNISIDNVIDAQEAVAYDCLCGMPWGIVWAMRSTFFDIKSNKKGGRHARG